MLTSKPTLFIPPTAEIKSFFLDIPEHTYTLQTKRTKQSQCGLRGDNSNILQCTPSGLGVILSLLQVVTGSRHLSRLRFNEILHARD